MTSKRLALYLKDARVKAGLSQSEVAKELGYSNSQFVSNWERGKSSPPMKILNLLIDFYKIDKEVVMNIILEDTKIYLQAELDRSTVKISNCT